MSVGIGKFSEMTGLAPHRLRLLDRKGQFLPETKTKSGYRRYSESQIEEAQQYVKRMKLLPDGKDG